ncbi:MAG: amidohydrolase [Victivallales bacterium]|nr:amidohydrolase [Victivallales bacterium]
MQKRTLKLKNVVVDGKIVDAFISNGTYARIAPNLADEAEETIDFAGGRALVPAFYNTHTHSAMTILRGYADDLALFDWLNNHIWPVEATLSYDDIYIGARLAMLEMLRSGIVCLNDSYWLPAATARAAAEMGLRGAVGLFRCGSADQTQAGYEAALAYESSLPSRVFYNIAPHSVYTLSPKQLEEIAEEARTTGRAIQVHASETADEVANCRKSYGMTPIQLLEKCGLLDERTVLAHCVHLTPEDIEILARTKAVIAHNPVSNAKLCSGMFDLAGTIAGGCRVTIGTDGCASNNCLSMFDEMKAAALTAKIRTQDPTAGPASLIYDLATRQGALAMGLDAGEIAPGKLADGILLDLSHPILSANYNLVSDLVYAADPSVVTDVLCDGAFVLRNGHVPGEAEILADARRVCARIKAHA